MNLLKTSIKKFLVCFGYLLIAFTLNSCVTDEETNPISNQQNDKIKTWYESLNGQIPDLNNIPYWKSRINSNFPSLNKRIIWDNRIEYTFASGRKAWEYRLEYENNYNTILSGRKLYQQSESVIFVESSSGYTIYILKFFDEGEKTETIGFDSYSLRKLPKDFSGQVTLNGFDDKILATYQYENGIYVSRGTVEKAHEPDEKDLNKSSNSSMICFDVELEYNEVVSLGFDVTYGSEYILYTETITICITSHSSGGGSGSGSGSGGPGGGNGDDGSGDSGSPAEEEMDVGETLIYFDDFLLEDPCLHAQALGEDSNFKENFNNLKNSISQGYESYGLIVRNSIGIYEYGIGRGLYGVPQVNFSPTTPIDGFIHSHYEGLDPIFSLADVNAIYQLHENNLLANGLESFVMGVITENTAYILKVEDEVAFLNFAEENFNSVNNFNALQNYFENWVAVNMALMMDDIQSYEHAFLKAFENAGLVLFRAVGQDDLLDSWERRKINDQGTNSIANGC
ncbi:hypothetical protein MM236_00490 [Belliella sp. DSM 107340]|uniref:Uncharacterized protein n=1 Tax=Belliella calami TaxID=2923436 RepID=A0ABS9UIJ4_9BACT|nr:hypothetical protein [Belliella calami]MCH7396437.1 hypothetical protein [Belliella calami]